MKQTRPLLIFGILAILGLATAYYFFFLLQNRVSNADIPLAILGEREVGKNGDTIYHQIPNFSFINQDSQSVSNQTLAGKIYVADFFFTSCPTICPKVTAQMLRVKAAFENNDTVLLVSHTIDPRHDTPHHLTEYAKKIGVQDTKKWLFLTGEQDSLYDIADDYFSVAKVDPDAAGGFDHSGRLILVDKQRRVRSFCDGTNAEEVDRFILDIKRLLREQK